jgi:hypothetical protein
MHREVTISSSGSFSFSSCAGIRTEATWPQNPGRDPSDELLNDMALGLSPCLRPPFNLKAIPRIALQQR